MMNSSFSQPEPPVDFGAVQEFVYQQVLGHDSANKQSFRPSIFDPEPEQKKTESAAGEPQQPSVNESDVARREADAYARGLNAGRDEVRGAAQQAVEDARRQIAENLKNFEQERDLYFRKMEAEIVELALAVARKVLHREAQVDKVVLSGVVRVALEKIAGDGHVTLHVHPSSADAWRQYINEQHDLGVVPEVVADSFMQLDQLVLKTAHGNTELGINAQLKEIDKGFTDLVAQKKRSLRQ
jgi:flagellar assembly protein FliH